jgi:hypothetical protein
MAYFARHSLGARTAVALKNVDENSYGHITEPFAQSFTADGGQVLAVELYAPTDDFAMILHKYAASPPDVLSRTADKLLPLSLTHPQMISPIF